MKIKTFIYIFNLFRSIVKVIIDQHHSGLQAQHDTKLCSRWCQFVITLWLSWKKQHVTTLFKTYFMTIMLQLHLTPGITYLSTSFSICWKSSGSSGAVLGSTPSVVIKPSMQNRKSITQHSISWWRAVISNVIDWAMRVNWLQIVFKLLIPDLKNLGTKV